MEFPVIGLEWLNRRVHYNVILKRGVSPAFEAVLLKFKPERTIPTGSNMPEPQFSQPCKMVTSCALKSVSVCRDPNRTRFR